MEPLVSTLADQEKASEVILAKSTMTLTNKVTDSQFNSSEKELHVKNKIRAINTTQSRFAQPTISSS